MDSEDYYRTGFEYVDAGNYHKALENFIEAIRLNSDISKYRNGQGSALVNLKRYPEALAAFNRAIELDDKFADYHHSQGVALFNLKRYPEALAAHDQAIKLDANVAVYYHGRGVALSDLKRYSEALAAYGQAIELDANIAFYHHNRGIALNDLKRYSEALAAFDRAIEMDGNVASYHHSRGISLSDLKRYPEALAAHERAIELNDNIGDYHHSQGIALHNLKRYLEAVAAYERAIELDANDADYHHSRGYTLANLKRYPEALAAFNRAIELDTNVAVYHHGQGIALRNLKRYLEALAAYDQAIELDDNFASYHHSRGIALRNLKRYLEALAAHERAIELDDNFADYHHGRGIVLRNLKRYLEALAAHERAIELDANDAGYHHSRGITLNDLKRYPETLAAHDQAIELDANVAVYHHGRGIALRNLKRYLEALAAHDQAIKLDNKFADYHHGRGIALNDLKRYLEALAAFDRAIEMDGNVASYHHSRGNALFNLKRYLEALAAFNRAIEMDDVLGISYYGRASIYNVLFDYAAVQANYVRYIFLGQAEPADYFTLLAFFRDYGDAPFVVKRLLGEQLAYYYTDSYRSFIERIDTQCRPVQDCLDWVAMQDWPRQSPNSYLLFEALCQYFMGDTAEAYFIFDYKFDPDSLSLMEQYYYVRSALYSARPESSLRYIRDEALEAARIVANDSTTPPFQRYYAGLILYHFSQDEGDVTLAGHCFAHAKDLIAAKYMRWQLATPQERPALREEILAHEASMPPEKGFANGILPHSIGRDFIHYNETIQHYCFYHELTEAIQGIHSPNAPLHMTAFHEYWKFVLSDEKEKQPNGQEKPSEQDLIIRFRNMREAEKSYEQVSRLLETMREFLNIEQIEENIRSRLGSLYEKLVFLKEQAARDALAQRLGGIEDLIASHIWESAEYNTFENLNIRGLRFWEVHQQFILYFLGRNQISVPAAINLIMYAGYSAVRENLYDSVRQSASLDGTSDLLKAVPNVDQVQKMMNDLKESEEMQEFAKVLAGGIGTTMLPIGSTLSGAFLLGFIVKSLLTILEKRFIKPKEKMPYSEDYANFLRDLDAHVAAARREGTMDPIVEKILGLV